MKRIGALLIIFVVVLAGTFLFWDDLNDFFFRFFVKLPQIEEGLTDLVENIEKQITTPDPLRATQEAPQSFLTKAGVIAFTNSQRAKYGLPALAENTTLDQSAELKAQDMFLNQYFAHDSPLGVTLGDLAGKVGYEFIAIGENLALGNFENDETLVQAWMDSPGHRANILNSHYQEIGVAVIKGTFEGKTTWLAVQHFGLSLSVCPEPSEAVKASITVNQIKIDELAKQLAALAVEIKTMRRRDSDYQEKINQYNELVAEYNSLVEQTKVIINEYNYEVKLFNECLSGI